MTHPSAPSATTHVPTKKSARPSFPGPGASACLRRTRMPSVQEEARRIAADILIGLDRGDLEDRIYPTPTDAFLTAVYAEVRAIGARIEQGGDA